MLADFFHFFKSLENICFSSYFQSGHKSEELFEGNAKEMHFACENTSINMLALG